MRGLSLTQPWASLVALKAKRIETRSWATSYRGPVAIHAAKGLGPIGGARGLAEICAEEPFYAALAPMLTTERPRGTAFLAGKGADGQQVYLPLPLGAIVAVAELYACHQVGAYPPPAGDEYLFGNYGRGRWMWFFRNVRRLPESVPCRGALGLWPVPPDVLAQLADPRQVDA